MDLASLKSIERKLWAPWLWRWKDLLDKVQVRVNDTMKARHKNCMRSGRVWPRNGESLILLSTPT